MTERSIVYVVDDDKEVRQSTRALLESAGFTVRDFSSAETLLAENLSDGGCLIADICMPGMDGLELQEEIVRRGIDLPVVFMTGHGDVPLAVRAMRAGALEFIEKPFDDDALIATVTRALALDRHADQKAAEAKAARELLALLTPRERHVLARILAGRSNKVSAYELGISPRTIEVHRARIMDKTKARSLSGLVRIALVAGETGGGPLGPTIAVS
jgi:two-component system response regulator FixJ